MSFLFVIFNQERIDDSDTEIPDKYVNVLAKNSTIRKCLQGRTDTQIDMLEAGDYFYPFEMEFCLSTVEPLWSLRNEQGTLQDKTIHWN